MQIHHDLQEALDKEHIHLSSLKRLAKLHLGLSFDKKAKHSTILEAIQRATSPINAAPAQADPDPPHGAQRLMRRSWLRNARS